MGTSLADASQNGEDLSEQEQEPSCVDHDLDCVRRSIVGDQQLDAECLGLVPFYSLMDTGAVDPVTP